MNKNMKLSDTYEIELYSTWLDKSGGSYTVVLLKNLDVGGMKIPIVLYIKTLSAKEKLEFANKKIPNQFVKTVGHFKNSFTLSSK